jgi:hypothetical protein
MLFLRGPFRSFGGCHLAVVSMDGERSSVERPGFFYALFRLLLHNRGSDFGAVN